MHLIDAVPIFLTLTLTPPPVQNKISCTNHGTMNLFENLNSFTQVFLEGVSLKVCISMYAYIFMYKLSNPLHTYTQVFFERC